MKTTEGLFSIRIVVADFYMHRPISGLDPTYSDFRGHEIKSIPVIRIFGSKPDGEKTCMHVHGVFPYFYIPYVEDIAPDSDQLTYQIAASLDKAINISLGQTNSQSQHVFKIQLVQGRPFYGYHHKKHQFLKIFLYNPRFVKKAANLLLNGAILGKSFQPHESHVPYILQFFIDYNLYGMSFLHVPMEIVKYRQSDEYEVPVGFENEQILSQKITRVSTSRHEVDIAAGFILNRFEHLNKDTGNTNPGIESIWQDERVRRKKLSDEQEVPPLDIPPSQERLLAKPTESDIFYKAALRAKLAMENAGEKLLNASILSNSTVNERKQKFNLVKLLENSVYPSECSQVMNATLANASKIPDHISSNSLFHSSMRGRSTSRSSVSMNDSFVDEEIVLSLSQPQQKLSLDQTLQGEDFELLEVMQQLEEDEGEIDLDSTLAPLSQMPKNVLQIPNEIAKDISPENIDKPESDEEEDDMNYTISMDSVDKILMELSQPQNSEKIPQLDGGDDLWSTPKKRRITRNSKLKGSPRSPKIPSASKYAPLDITINKSPVVKKEDINGNDSSSVVNITPFSVSSNGQLISSKSPSIRVKRLLINLDKEFSNMNNTKRHKINGTVLPPVDENSFIVCNLKPRSPKKSPLIVEKCDEAIKNSSTIKGSSSEKLHLKKCRVKMKRMHFNAKVTPAEIKDSAIAENILNISFNEEIRCEMINEDEKQSNVNGCVSINLDEDDDAASDAKSIEKLEDQISITSEIINLDNCSLKDGFVNGPYKPTEIIYIDNDSSNNGFVNKPSEISETNIVDECSLNNDLVEGLKIVDELKPDQNPCNIVSLIDSAVTSVVKTTDESILNVDCANIVDTDDDAVNNNNESNPTIVDEELKEDVIASDKNSNKIICDKITEAELEKDINVSQNNNNDKNVCIPAEEEESPEESEPDRANLDANGFVKSNIRAVEVRNEIMNRRKSWSPCNLSREFDRKNNFYPKPGPSGLRKGKMRERKKPARTPSSKVQTRLKTKQQQVIPEIIEEQCGLEPEEDLNICSFYEKSMVIDSPSLFSEFSPQTPKCESEFEQNSAENLNIQSIIQMSSSQLITITPRDLPPTFEDADEKSIEFGIPDEVFPEPFYGNDADVTGKREIGPTVLHIPGRSLNSCPDFESLIPHLKGLNVWRKNILESIIGDMAKDLQHVNSIKEYFSCQERVSIVSQNPPPSREDAKNWLINMARNHTKSKKINNNEDSPIKVRKEKVKMILDESTLGADGETCDLSQKSISLTPLTPDNMKHEKMEIKPATTSNKKITPINKICDQTTPLSALQKFKERRRSRARLSLAKKLHRLGSLESNSSGTDSEILKIPTNINGGLQIIQQPILVVDDSNDSEKYSERSFGSQQISDLCSEKVKQVLERTSFIRNLSIMENYGSGDESFGLSGVTLDNTFGFKISLQNLQDAKADIEHNHLTVFSLEIHVNTRGDLKPDPQYDAVDCLFFNISHDGPETEGKINKTVGCIIVSEDMNLSLNGVATRYVPVKSEFELFDKLLQLCQEWNPDIFVGYEIEMRSWGYLIDRAHVLGMNLKAFLSRVPTQKVRDAPATDEEKEGFTDLDIELKLCGRILLDVWRLMRSEIALTSYTFENVMFHILHRRVPLHNYRDLTKWYSSSNTRWIVLEYYLERVNGTMELLDQLDLIGRTSEMAKLIGIQFYEVLSRGSQFRVESMMLRIAKPKNFVPVSPSIQQRAHSRAPEYLPLILEPKSRFYADPMIVLDFQSLYPSMIIAYNYCFSTCLGRVEHLGQSTPFEFGCSQLRVSRSELNRLIDNDLISISPCGVVFVKSEVREGVLPRMLKEILETRIMVKQSMKLHKTNSILQRVLHSRQLGLKLMANVTYGYTSANFSGRMACVEVADSVVGKGRETLERAIKLVEANKDWRAKVVYGDTDSLFILVPGRCRAEAFRIGEEIAEAVTNDNPQPVKLKLEKVYQPCILQTKKRYVGYMYESADQEEPVYEAKGIETVRRDGCPAVAKMLEKCLRILFESCDVSEVKRYVCRQFTKLLTGNANVQDLIFAKEFRGKNGYKPGACVPALELTRKWLQTDPRSEPRRGERVPFLIVNGPPGLPLIRLVRSPHEYLSDEGLKINAIYYITKAIIPPLNRCLLLIGADVNEWFAELPRKHIALPTISTVSSTKRIFQDVKKSTISQYFASSNCIIDCGRHSKAGICTVCVKDSQKCTAILSQKISKLERSYYLTKQLCQSCCGRLDNIDCCSLDCPVLFVSNMKSRDSKQVQHFQDIFKDKFSVHNLL